MRMVFAIKESSHGLWCISNGEALVHDKLRFAHAIRLSRALARAEHERTGDTVSVEMVCSEFTITLLNFALATTTRHVTKGQAEAWRGQGELSAAERNPEPFLASMTPHPLVAGSATRLHAIY